MKNGGAPKKCLSGIIILENGMEAKFLIDQKEEAALRRYAASMASLLKRMGSCLDYNMADQLVIGAVVPYLKQITKEGGDARQMGQMI